MSHNLIKAGKKVLVIDEAKPHTASKIASGIINPVTGRRIVRTWMIETLLPFALNTYKELEEELNIALVKECTLLDFHPTSQMKEAFDVRSQLESEYLHRPQKEENWQRYFRYNYGIGEVSPCLLVDIQTLLKEWRSKLLQYNLLLEENFDWSVCKIEKHIITYKGITASKLICCEGVEGTQNPYFKLLPYAPNKGEALIVAIRGLPKENIYKQGITIVPWKKDDLFWIGSTYEWNYRDTYPTQAFRKKVEEQLNYWLKLPYNIIDHWASERPANVERRPFVGVHPLYTSLCIFNGMGTKGCSLAPYFARELTEHLIHNTPLSPSADVQRFARILSRL
jgi:glycine/D-amino acid oxidase-like deaminating enzyme